MSRQWTKVPANEDEEEADDASSPPPPPPRSAGQLLLAVVHRDLLSHYKLEEGDLGAPPLLLLDLLSGGSMPFSVPGAAWDSLEPSKSAKRD